MSASPKMSQSNSTILKFVLVALGMSASVEVADSGLAGLILVLRFLEISADTEQLRQRLKARSVAKTRAELDKAPLPIIAQNKDGTLVILARIADGKAMIPNSISGRPTLTTKKEFGETWSGCRRSGNRHPCTGCRQY